MKIVSNPFVISGYEGEKYFCDRQQELAQLRLEIENGNDVALIASRRMEKWVGDCRVTVGIEGLKNVWDCNAP